MCIRDSDKVAEGVYVTTYENGRRIAVNYTENDSTVDGVTVPAQGFVVVNR